MSDPSLAIQDAQIAALKAAPAVAEGRIYDSVPEGATFPYVTVGRGDIIGDDTDCVDSSIATTLVEVWSRTPGFPECKAIAGEVRSRCAAEFALSGFTIINAEFRLTRYLREPDGKTSRAIVEIRYLVDHD